LEGTVIKTTGSWHLVQAGEGKPVACKLRGAFRLKGSKATNPVVAGDRVYFDPAPDGESGVIREICPRKNYIIRKAAKLSKVSQVLAANLDEAWVIASLRQPRTSTGFLDRFLVTAEAYHIPAAIVFNKTDLYNGDDGERLEALRHLYVSIGYRCHAVSALTGDGIPRLKEALVNRQTLFSGHSGVGKTALINALEPGLGLRTGEISAWHNKGQHTTTFAEMIRLTPGGYIVDTPGIREFGLIDFSKQEIAERFPEMRSLMHNCRFNDCTHVHEPGCAVKDALAKKLISPLRYGNYLSILNDDYWEEIEKDYDL